MKLKADDSLIVQDEVCTLGIILGLFKMLDFHSHDSSQAVLLVVTGSGEPNGGFCHYNVMHVHAPYSAFPCNFANEMTQISLPKGSRCESLFFPSCLLDLPCEEALGEAGCELSLHSA